VLWNGFQGYYFPIFALHVIEQFFVHRCDELFMAGLLKDFVQLHCVWIRSNERRHMFCQEGKRMHLGVSFDVGLEKE
jgi:hypothetical protein